jgi:hypothetical protein
MERATNYSVITDVYGAVQEKDSFTCFHCGTVHFVKPFQKPEEYGGICFVCKQLVCPGCVKLGKCDPLERKLARYENRLKFLKDAGLS